MRLYDLTHHTSGIIVLPIRADPSIRLGYERRTAARQDGQAGIPPVRCDGHYLPA